MTSGDRERAWLEPWLPVADGTALENELRHEVGESHALYRRSARAIARRADQDDVLFELDGDGQQLAVVHLTWTAKPEADPRWPATVLFTSWSDWLVRMMDDHRDIKEG